MRECATITTRSLSVAKFMLTTGRPTLTGVLRALDEEMPDLAFSDFLSAYALIVALAADPSKIMIPGAGKPKPNAGGAIAWLDQMLQRARAGVYHRSAAGS